MLLFGCIHLNVAWKNQGSAQASQVTQDTPLGTGFLGYNHRPLCCSQAPRQLQHAALTIRHGHLLPWINTYWMRSSEKESSGINSAFLSPIHLSNRLKNSTHISENKQLLGMKQFKKPFSSCLGVWTSIATKIDLISMIFQFLRAWTGSNVDLLTFTTVNSLVSCMNFMNTYFLKSQKPLWHSPQFFCSCVNINHM